MSEQGGYVVIVMRRGVPHTVDEWHRVRPLADGPAIIEDVTQADWLAEIHHGQAIPVDMLSVSVTEPADVD